MPTLASSYHWGNGLWSKLAQLGWYRVRGPGTCASTSAAEIHTTISATRSGIQAEIAISSISRQFDFWLTVMRPPRFVIETQLRIVLSGERFSEIAGIQQCEFAFVSVRYRYNHFHKGIHLRYTEKQIEIIFIIYLNRTTSLVIRS